MVLVFSLENEASFQEVYKLYSQLNTLRSTAEIPLVVVGTQGRGQEAGMDDFRGWIKAIHYNGHVTDRDPL